MQQVFICIRHSAGESSGGKIAELVGQKLLQPAVSLSRQQREAADADGFDSVLVWIQTILAVKEAG